MADLPDMKAVPRPPLIFEAEGIEDIKMTYGLEMDIRRMLPDPQTAMQLCVYDTFTQDYIIRRCLTKLNKLVTDPDELIKSEEVTLDADDRDRLIKWALEHSLYFFAKRTTAMGELAVQFSPILNQPQQTPSTNGSPPSPSQTPSAGDSESSKDS